MKNKGFTLIELLGVIVILALLVILVFPSIINSVKNSSEKTDDLTLKLIYNASELFISNHTNDFPKVNGNKFTILLTDLVAEDLLASPIKLSESDKDLTDSKCVQVTYNDGYKYELKDTCVFDIKCSLKDNDNDETASLSDEVTCGNESFYVMSNDGTNITMLAAKNINIDLANPIQSDSAREIAFSTTNYWESTITKYPAYVYGDYKDANGVQQNLIYPYVEAYEIYLKETLKIKISSATLMSFEQAEDLECDSINFTCESAPEWVYSTNYWLGSAGNSTHLWDITHINSYFNGLPYKDDYDGIRPVVTLPLESVSIMK